LNIIDKIINHIEEILIVIMMAYMTIMNFINVLGRYVFSASFSFTEELTVTVFVWVTMLGIALGFKRNVHLGMSFVVDPQSWQSKGCIDSFKWYLPVYFLQLFC